MITPQISILIDGRYLIDPKTGISKYLKSLIKGLLSSDSVLNIGIVLGKGDHIKDAKSLLEFSESFESGKLYFHKNNFSRNIFIHAFFSHLIINSSSADVYIHPHYDCPLFITKKFLFVLHDFNPLVQTQYFSSFNNIKKKIFKLFIKKAMDNNSSACICISENTFSDTKKFIGEHSVIKTDVIYSGIDLEVASSDVNIFHKNFIFYVGDRRSHKNLKRMVDLFVLMKAENLYTGDFIIAGNKSNDGFNLESYVNNIPDIKIIGPVSESQLSMLYENCDALFYLSTYEGFGIPLVEASIFNKKIITSDSSSLKEIAPNCALLLNLKLSNEDIVKKISIYLNENLKIDNNEYLKRFNRNYVAESYISFIKKNLNI